MPISRCLFPGVSWKKKKDHAEGFAKECAVVTHYRLKTNPNKKGELMVDPDPNWKKN